MIFPRGANIAIQGFSHELKGLLDEKIVYPIFISVNYNYEISKKGVLGFAISYLVLEIFRFLT